MADRKISDLTALTTPATGDLIPIVDISEAAAADKNKSITVQELFKGVPDGTAAAPGLAFESDDGNGIFLAGTDQVGVATGGVERVEFGASEVVFNDGGADYDFRIEGDTNTALFFVDASTDRVGVGTTSPSAPLEISNSVPIIRLTDSDGTNTYGQISASTATLTFAHRNNASNGQIVFQGLGGGVTDEYARFDTLGRLGIGTSSPSEVLDLRSTGTTRIFFESNDGGSPEYRATVGVDSGGFKIQTRDGTYGSNTDRLTIDTSGRVGIGTTSPGSLLQLTGSGVGANYLVINASSSGSETLEVGVPSGGGNVQLTATHSGGGSNSAGFIFRTRAGSSGTAERVRIDSSGRLLVGTSSSRSVDNEKILQIEGVNQQSSSMSLTRNTNSSAPPNISFGKSRGSTLGSNTIVQSGDSLGVIVFCGADGSDTNSIAAAITGQVDGTPGSNDMPGRLVFSTTANGASSPTERGKFDSDGYIYCYQSYTGTTAIAANLVVLSNGAFLRSSSSAKYKTQIEDLQNQYADALLDCRPVWYRSTCAADNPKHGYWGFIAEEVAEIDPRLVHWKTTEITYDEKGSAVETPCDPEPEGVAYDRFVPHLLNLIKRQKEQIEALEARLTAAGI